MHGCRVLKCDIADGGCRFPTPGIWAALGPTSRHCHLTLADPGIAIQNLGVFGVLRHVLAQKCNCQPLSRLWPTAVIVQVQTFPCLIRGRTLIQRLDDGQWMRSVKKNEQIAWSNVLWQASVCSWCLPVLRSRSLRCPTRHMCTSTHTAGRGVSGLWKFERVLCDHLLVRGIASLLGPLSKQKS